MKSYTLGFLVAGSGFVMAMVLWVVGYLVLPNADTHRHLSQNPRILTSVPNQPGQPGSVGIPTSTKASKSGSSVGGVGGSGSKSAISWYTVDNASKTVKLVIQAGDPTVDSGMNFNGYDNGQLVITVPLHDTVQIDFQNVDSSIPHSVGIVPWPEHLNFQAPAAFPGSEEPNFNSGITSANGTVHLSFVASKPGKYGLICGIPGHAASGMWDVLEVSSQGKASVQTPKGTFTFGQ